jgi:hypothetical protein
MDQSDILKNIPLQFSQQIFFGTCTDDKDPLMLGRIRAIADQDYVESLLKVYPGFDENSTTPDVNGLWSPLDPFVYLPLLPYFINQTPKVGELVTIYYFNSRNQVGKNKFYMIGPYSSPVNTNTDDERTQRKHLDSGYRQSSESLINIKDSLGNYYNPNSKGVFAEPIDISIKGRDTADVIVKKDTVLIRAGKHKDFQSGAIPDYDLNRAFLQLSKFNTKTSFGDEKQQLRLISQDQPIKFLIEYDIHNPENQFDLFTGNIIIYKFEDPNNSSILVSAFKQNTDITNIAKTKVRMIDFQNDPLSMNEIIKRVNETIITLKDSPNSLLINKISVGSQFPFYYRPSKIILDRKNNTNPNSDAYTITNLNKLLNGVKVSKNNVTIGYGIVNDVKLSPTLPFKPLKEKYRESKTEVLNTTIGLMGANKLYFLAHDEVKPNQKPIDYDGTIYGIDEDKVYNEIQSKTSSTVRGEELLELLELIVGFCITHVHPFPLRPPSKKSLDNTEVDVLLQKMQEAYQKILNKNIRIN